MNRKHSAALLALLTIGSFAWWSGVQADDDSQPALKTREVAELLDRIEKLERRMDLFERNGNPVVTTSGLESSAGSRFPDSRSGSEPVPPQVGIIYRLKKFTPDTPDSRPRTAIHSGETIITR